MNSKTQEQKNRADLNISPQDLSITGSAAYSPLFLSAAADLFSKSGRAHAALNLSSAWKNVKMLQGAYGEVNKNLITQKGQKPYSSPIGLSAGYGTSFGEGSLNVNGSGSYGQPSTGSINYNQNMPNGNFNFNVSKTENQKPSLSAGYSTNVFGGELDVQAKTPMSPEDRQAEITWTKKF